jgi:DNA helicase-2/ATP-dependent DNA helicase PcrA
MKHWPEKIAEVGELGEGVVEYTLGHRRIRDGRISIHHDDVLVLTIFLMESSKFRQIITNRYPIILIDEYQDANVNWIESIKEHYLGQSGAPQFGFFGDHWQKIYDYGCGKIEHPSLRVIPKHANFRSVITIVDCLNRMRPELPQFVVDPNEVGYFRVFHTNGWKGNRQTTAHWKGDLPNDVADDVLQLVLQRLESKGWDLSPTRTKILMLTHRALAGKQGYGTLPSVFAYNESFVKKENPHIAFFADALEPACEAFLARKYGDMFVALGGNIPAIRRQADKEKWSSAMAWLIKLRESGTVGEVIDHLRQARLPRLPDTVERREHELESSNQRSGEEMADSLKELQSLRAVSYQEIIALCRYLAGCSPFETKHGVKGAEFENVLVVVGRGWNKYNFNEIA